LRVYYGGAMNFKKISHNPRELTKSPGPQAGSGPQARSMLSGSAISGVFSAPYNGDAMSRPGASVAGLEISLTEASPNDVNLKVSHLAGQLAHAATHEAARALRPAYQIGRASCRERV